MKILVFVPKGETRVPNQGEYIKYGDNVCYVGDCYLYPNYYPILIKYTIEVPEQAEALYYRFFLPKTQITWRGCDQAIPIKPQKKVKKWLWVVEGSTVIHGPYTETEIKEKFQIERKWYHKIDETEIEEMRKEIREEKSIEYSNYDPGLLNDYGGGNVEWWHDYIRAEIDRCNEYWRHQLEEK